ncbi:MAG: hypothetical protein ABW151_06050 [Pseudorhodoplanes sp.]
MQSPFRDDVTEDKATKTIWQRLVHSNGCQWDGDCVGTALAVRLLVGKALDLDLIF